MLNDTKFLKGDSPPPTEREDPLLKDPDTTMEIDSDHIPTRQKRAASSSPQDPWYSFYLLTCIGSCLQLNSCRVLKRTKAYANLEDIRPTIRNKPSGLKLDWHRTALKPPMPHQQVSLKHTWSSSLASTLSSVPPSPVLESNHTLSLLAMSPLSSVSEPPPSLSHGDLVPAIDRAAIKWKEPAQVDVVCIFINILCMLELILQTKPPSLSISLAHTRMAKATDGSLVSRTYQLGCARPSVIDLFVVSSNRFA